jgi:uncharacterized phiE125 gp8 family phage protein
MRERCVLSFSFATWGLFHMEQPLFFVRGCMTRLTRISGPDLEPVTWAEARDFLKLSGVSEQTLVELMISAARQAVEELTGRVLMTQQWELRLDRWPISTTAEVCPDSGCQIIPIGGQVVVRLPRAPILSVDTVEVVNSLGTFVTVPETDYEVDAGQDGGRLVAAIGIRLPEPGRAIDGIRIRLTAGYGSLRTDVPAALRQAILGLVAVWYERRDVSEKQGSFPPAVAEMLRPYRLFRL